MNVSCVINGETVQTSIIVYFENENPVLYVVNPLDNTWEGVTKEDWANLNYQVLSIIPWEHEQLKKFLGFDPVDFVLQTPLIEEIKPEESKLDKLWNFTNKYNTAFTILFLLALITHMFLLGIGFY